MFYYKTPNDELHVLDDSKFEYVLPQGTAPLTYEEYIALAIPPKTIAQMVAEYEAATTQHLDAYAKTWKYVSMSDVATYLNSSVAKYKAEAAVLIAWRDITWEAFDTITAKIEAAAKDSPTTVEEFLALLPAEPTRP